MSLVEHVILVDEQDGPTGIEEKLKAHQEGLCHRAFSIFIFQNAEDPYLLLQQRASCKYHSPNLWTNTCCSHPRTGEDIIQTGKRRLKEEMGIETELSWVSKFHYVAHFENGLIENEIDHVLVGNLQDEAICYNPNEVQAYRWIPLTQLKKELSDHPEKFTPWLAKALELAENHTKSGSKSFKEEDILHFLFR